MHTTLISAATLARHALAHDWVILDCRHDLADPEAGRAWHAAGHLPGARFVHLDHDLSGPRLYDAAGRCTSGRHPLPARADFIDTLRRWGINDSTQVIAYDAHGGMFAARLWWMLRWVGHTAVAVLDGGLPAWQKLGQPLAVLPPVVVPAAPGNISLQPALTHCVTLEQVMENVAEYATENIAENAAQNGAQNVAQPTRTLLDARAPDRFRGENETIDPVGGHIPGAKNRFFKDNLQADGRFKPPAQLHAEFAALLPAPETAIMQCGSGVTACHHLLALEVAGLPGAALYPGSWSQWCADPARPVVRGAAG